MDEVKILAKINELEQRVSSLEDALRETKKSTAAPVKEQSLREFLNEKLPLTANDKALCIAYYLETAKGYESFNAEDIKDGFRQARIPLPKNPNDVINKNIKKAYVMDAEQNKGGKMAWVLTATGLAIIEKGFSKEK